jgi:hypothetical protein
MDNWTRIKDGPRQEPLLFRTYARRGEAAVGIINALGEICVLWGQDGIGFTPTHCMPIPQLPHVADVSSTVN